MATPSSASGRRMLHELRPNSRTDRPISMIASGGLSTVMKLAASTEPKNQADQLWERGQGSGRVVRVRVAADRQVPEVEDRRQGTHAESAARAHAASLGASPEQADHGRWERPPGGLPACRWVEPRVVMAALGRGPSHTFERGYERQGGRPARPVSRRSRPTTRPALRPATTLISRGPENARGQLTDIRAPPGASCRRASDRPLRGRSRRRSRGPGRRRPPRSWRGGSGRRSAVRSSSGMPGPGVVDGQPDPRRRRRPRDTVTEPPSGEYLQALSSSTPRSRSSHSGGAVTTIVPLGAPGRRGCRWRASATTPNRSTVWAASTARSTGSALGLTLRGVEARQPQQVVEQAAHPLRLAVDALERRPVPLRRAVLRQGQAGVRLDDRQRRAQLVRGVGRELQLALAGGLDRRRDAPADQHGTDEHDQEQHRPDQRARPG